MTTNSLDKELKFIQDKIRYSDNFPAFVTEVVGLKCESFHEGWIKSFEKNRFNLLLAPRGHGKSLLVGAYIIWNIVKNSNIKILVVTINQTRADDMMRFIQSNLETNDRLVNIFGEQKSNILWKSEKLMVKGAKDIDNPTLKVVGVTGGIVGGHFDIIILDDITDKENSRTEYRRRSLEKQLDSEIMQMFIPNSSYKKVIIIGTKWHESDIYKYASKKPGYTFNKYQAVLYEPKELYTFVTELDWNVLEEGEHIPIISDFINKLPDDKKPKVLWKEFVPYTELARIRRADGNVAFMMQYQNEFISDMDAPIKYDWVQAALSNYKIPEHPYQTFLGVDLASKGEDSDYFTIAVVAIKDGLVYVLDGVRTKESMFGQFELIRSMDNKWHPGKIGVEQAGQGKIIVDQYMEMSTLPIIPIKSSIVNDKMSRIQRLSVLFETGRIFIGPDEKFSSLVDELLSYPRGAHEDFADALSFAVIASQEFEDEGPTINWEEVAKMTKDCAKKSNNVKSVGDRFQFYKV